MSNALSPEVSTPEKPEEVSTVVTGWALSGAGVLNVLTG